jgi:hypothetical protein
MVLHKTTLLSNGNNFAAPQPAVPTIVEQSSVPIIAQKPSYNKELSDIIYNESIKYFYDLDEEPQYVQGGIYSRWIGSIRREYYKDGFNVDMATSDDYPIWQNYLYISPACEIKLYQEIGIGSTREELYREYEGAINFSVSTDELINVGKIWFVVKNDIVYSIYIGMGVYSEEYFGGFYPDREIGIPLDITTINPHSTDNPGLFYLGQYKEKIMSIIADRSVKWKEYPVDDAGCIVIGDEFIFVFDEDRKLTTVAIDKSIVSKYVGREPDGITFSYERVAAAGLPYTKQTVSRDDFLPDITEPYTKITMDMGTHYYFFCCRYDDRYQSYRMFRWGISVKEQ